MDCSRLSSGSWCEVSNAALHDLNDKIATKNRRMERMRSKLREKEKSIEILKQEKLKLLWQKLFLFHKISVLMTENQHLQDLMNNNSSVVQIQAKNCHLERGSSYYSQPRSRPVNKIGPLVSRLFTEWWAVKKPQQVSFKHQSCRDADLSSLCYDESVGDSYFSQCFIVESKLGEGSFGEVFKVRNREDGRLYAVKKSLGTFRSATDKMEKLREVQKHEQLPRHPNLVRFVKAWEEQGSLYIQTELCKTNLNSLSESYHELSETTVRNYLVDLLMAVKYLHDHDLIHLDIKPENIFVDRFGVLKLGDFGLVTETSTVNEHNIIEGDSKYLAPEILHGVIGKHVDIFSLGITILEIACDLDLPSYGETWQSLRSGKLPDAVVSMMTHLSKNLCDVIQLMMHSDFTLRPSASELLDDVWIQPIAEKRRLSIQYRKLLDLLRMVRCVFFLLGLCLLRRWPLTLVNLTGSLLHCYRTASKHQSGGISATKSRAKRKNNLAAVSSFNGVKRKLTAINSSGESDEDENRLDRCPPALMARLSFSDEDTTAAFDEDEILQDLSAIDKPEELLIDASFDQTAANENLHQSDKPACQNGEDLAYDELADQSFPFGSFRSEIRPCNSTPARERLKKRAILDRNELHSFAASSPIAKMLPYKRNGTLSAVVNGFEITKSIFKRQSNGTGSNERIDAISVSLSTPDELLKLNHPRHMTVPVKIGEMTKVTLTPRNLFKEFGEDSY